MDLVADASALVLAVSDTSQRGVQLLERFRAATVHAPHLVDAEVGSALRRMVMHDGLQLAAAISMGRSAAGLVNERYPHGLELCDWAWANHTVLTFYDAQYAALAQILGYTLVTADGRIGRAPLRGLEVEVR